MSLLALGINHQTAPVDLRERVAFDSGMLAPALAALHALPQVREVALLSTCNRTELWRADHRTATTLLVDWLAAHPQERRTGRGARHRRCAISLPPLRGRAPSVPRRDRRIRSCSANRRSSAR